MWLARVSERASATAAGSYSIYVMVYIPHTELSDDRPDGNMGVWNQDSGLG